jgi:hypothetical protein
VRVLLESERLEAAELAAHTDQLREALEQVRAFRRYPVCVSWSR